MKLDENNQQHLEYIGRYLAGEMLDEERRIFEGEIDMFDENKELLAQMKKEWRLMGKYNDSKMVNTDIAWAKLADRFEEDGLLPKHTIIAKQPKRITPMLRWAVAALVVMAVGSTWIYTSHRLKVRSQLVNLSTGSEPIALIHTLGDGSTVYLASNTSLSFPKEFDTRERKVELNGEAFFDVAHNSRQPFLIETAAATIQVLGTAFNVRSETSSTFELIVERGKVKVTLKDGSSNSFVVSAGERLAAVGSKVSIVKNSNNDYMAWRLQRMQFKDERLQDVVNVLNRNYHSSIVLASSELGNRRLTVTFSNNTLSSITDLICLALQLKSEVRSDTVIISQADGQRIK